MKHPFSSLATLPTEGTARGRKTVKMFLAGMSGTGGLAMPLWERLGDYFSQPEDLLLQISRAQ